jgi:hypothetical protein
MARALGLLDMEMLGQSVQRLALVSARQAARAGEMTDLGAICATCCFLVAACDQVRDYDRAAQLMAPLQVVTQGDHVVRPFHAAIVRAAPVPVAL